MNINRVYKLVDTCAAEFTASTPYYYSTFENEIEDTNGNRYSQNESIVTDKKKIIVLGSGGALNPHGKVKVYLFHEYYDEDY